MNEHDTQFDHHPHEVGPEIDDTVNPTQPDPEPRSDWSQASGSESASGQRPRATAGREMLIQLQQMIDTAALQAGPVMREVAAKAAELAAVAGEKAGPAAHRAAQVTETVGQRVAARSKEMAADLRRPRDPETGEEAGSSAGYEGEPADTADPPAQP